MTVALVTGGTGFIGSHLVRRLLRREVSVHVLCRRDSDRWRLSDLGTQVVWHSERLRDRLSLRRLAARVRPDYVFHLAAATMHGGRSAPAKEIMTTTLLGTVNLIEACEAVPYRCFVITGDGFEYGPSRRAPRESDPCRPTTVDGIAKLAASLYALHVARQRQRPITIVRPCSVYGARDDPRRLISRLVDAALDRRPVALSHPRVARDFLYVDDIVELYLALIRRPARVIGEIFNAGSGRQTALGELVRLITRLSGTPCDARWGTYAVAAHDTEPRRADVSKARAILGWRPRTSLQRGLAHTIAAARGQRA